MTQPDLAAIREYVEKATPGPWHVGGYFKPNCRDAWIDDSQSVIADMRFGNGADACDRAQVNAEFIARIRTDAVALLDLCEQQQRELKQKEAECRSLRESSDIFEKNSADATALWEENRSLKNQTAEQQRTIERLRHAAIRPGQPIKETTL